MNALVLASVLSLIRDDLLKKMEDLENELPESMMVERKPLISLQSTVIKEYPALEPLYGSIESISSMVDILTKMAKAKLHRDELPSNSVATRKKTIAKRKRKIQIGQDFVDETKRGVVRHKALVRDKTFVQKVASLFVAGDSQSIVSYVINDILLPTAKSTIQEVITSGIDMILFGEARSQNRSSGRSGYGRTTVSYGSYYQDRGVSNRRRYGKQSTSRDKFNLDDIFFRHGDEATEVLDQLCERLEEYKAVTVADFFDLASVDGATWAHNKYGWDDLSEAYCTHRREGYQIVLPSPIELE